MLTVESLDGRAFSLESYRGKEILINFWATGCVNSKVEMPGFPTYLHCMQGFVRFLLVLRVNLPGEGRLSIG